MIDNDNLEQAKMALADICTQYLKDHPRKNPWHTNQAKAREIISFCAHPSNAFEFLEGVSQKMSELSRGLTGSTLHKAVYDFLAQCIGRDPSVEPLNRYRSYASSMGSVGVTTMVPPPNQNELMAAAITEFIEAKVVKNLSM